MAEFDEKLHLAALIAVLGLWERFEECSPAWGSRASGKEFYIWSEKTACMPLRLLTLALSSYFHPSPCPLPNGGSAEVGTEGPALAALGRDLATAEQARGKKPRAGVQSTCVAANQSSRLATFRAGNFFGGFCFRALEFSKPSKSPVLPPDIHPHPQIRTT